eukprot:SAG31_NODE_11599_length_1014_cov_1.607650_1_plen_173_part_00
MQMDDRSTCEDTVPQRLRRHDTVCWRAKARTRLSSFTNSPLEKPQSARVRHRFPLHRCNALRCSCRSQLSDARARIWWTNGRLGACVRHSRIESRALISLSSTEAPILPTPSRIARSDRAGHGRSTGWGSMHCWHARCFSERSGTQPRVAVSLLHHWTLTARVRLPVAPGTI